MINKHSADELTEGEILQLLWRKLISQNGHQARLEKYRRTGRAIILSNDLKKENNSPVFSTIDLTSGQISKPREHISGVRIANDFLRYIEILALFSVVAFFGYGGNLLLNLNRRSSASWILPTLTPTPIIQAFILPEGHTPPNSPGGARPNIEEIPANLRPLVNTFASIPEPTSAPNQGVRIQITALNIDAPIIQGDGWDQLKKGVAQRIGSANPGEKGNMVLSGHNDVFGEVFRYLDRLTKGDQIIVFTSNRTYTYIVEGWTIVEPDQVEVMAPTLDAVVTLISCYPYLVDKQRIIVRANLVKD